MTTPELLQFVRTEHALGMSLNEIIQLLTTEGGWDREDVAEAFHVLGLPEEAVESFFAKDKKVVEPVVSPKVETSTKEEAFTAPSAKIQPELDKPIAPPTIKEKESPFTPQVHKQVGQAAPMHYVEEPEKAVKPTLARPASLTGQASRPLVRTLSTAASYAKVDTSNRHDGALIHVSKLQSGVGSVLHAAHDYPAEDQFVSKEEAAENKISEIERTLSFGVEMKEEEPKPKSVASAQGILSKDSHPSLTNMVIGKGGEIKDEIKVLVPSTVTSPTDIIAPAPVEEIKDIPKITEAEIPPLAQPVPAPVVDKIINEEIVEKKVEDMLSHIPQIAKVPVIEEIKHEKIEEPKLVIPETKQVEISKPEEKPLVAENITTPPTLPPPVIEEKKEEVATPAPIPKIEEAPKEEAPKIEPPKEEIPKVEPPKEEIKAPPIFTPPTPQPVAPPPQYIQLPPQQIYVMPPQMYGGQPPFSGFQPMAPTSGQPASMLNDSPHVAEISSTAPDLEEQAYLAQFGQAKMPEGLARPQPSMVAPTIIYAQAASPLSQPAPKVEEKKPEPIRFDIGRVRTARKTDQSAYTGRPSVISAVSGMQPVESKSMEDVFKASQGGAANTDLSSTAKKDAMHSIKIPHKRTMVSDLINVEEGSLSAQLVSQSTKEGTTSPLTTPNSVAAVVDEEPIPPPPPKKSTKSIWIISLVILFIILAGGAAAYYFIFLRLPGAEEVYNNALSVTTRGPALTYDATLKVLAKSTDAEPENINVEFHASGTLGIRSKSFDDGIHDLEFAIEQTGVPGPFSLDFNGSLKIIDDDIFVTQKSPAHGTKIENILKEGEWIKFPYRDLGKIMGLTSIDAVSIGDYGQISSSISLFKLATISSPVVTSGEIIKFAKDGREFYEIPVKLDGKKMVLIGDSLSKYLRGAESLSTDSVRAAVLENRYKEISGKLIVDRLSMKPVSLTLSGKFDPSKIPLDGEMILVVNFSFAQQLPKVVAEGETYEEIVAKRAEESVSEDIINRDAPYRALAPVLELAIKQYAEKIGRYPIQIDDLVSSGFIGKEAISPNMVSNIFYSSYVDTPKDTVSGVRCSTKNNKCDFYHLGINLEYRKSPELQKDSDFETSVISGNDESGCHKESGLICYDVFGERGIAPVTQ